MISVNFDTEPVSHRRCRERVRDTPARNNAANPAISGANAELQVVRIDVRELAKRVLGDFLGGVGFRAGCCGVSHG